jgi:hypothetical protein
VYANAAAAHDTIDEWHVRAIYRDYAAATYTSDIWCPRFAHGTAANVMGYVWWSAHWH